MNITVETIQRQPGPCTGAVKMTYRIKSRHPNFPFFVEVMHGVRDPERFVRNAIRDGYTILLITQERGTK